MDVKPLSWRGWIHTLDLKRNYIVDTKMCVHFSAGENQLEIWLNLFTIRTFVLKNITNF